MLILNKKTKLVNNKPKSYYDISLIIDRNNKLIVIDNTANDYHDFVDDDTLTVIPMIIKV